MIRIKAQCVTRIEAQPVIRIKAQCVTRIKAQHVTRIKAQHVTRIETQHVTRIEAQPVIRIKAQCVTRIQAQCVTGAHSLVGVSSQGTIQPGHVLPYHLTLAPLKEVTGCHTSPRPGASVSCPAPASGRPFLLVGNREVLEVPPRPFASCAVSPTKLLAPGTGRGGPAGTEASAGRCVGGQEDRRGWRPGAEGKPGRAKPRLQAAGVAARVKGACPRPAAWFRVRGGDGAAQRRERLSGYWGDLGAGPSLSALGSEPRVLPRGVPIPSPLQAFLWGGGTEP